MRIRTLHVMYVWHCFICVMVSIGLQCDMYWYVSEVLHVSGGGTCDVNTLHAVYSAALFHGFNQTAVRCVLVCERCVYSNFDGILLSFVKDLKTKNIAINADAMLKVCVCVGLCVCVCVCVYVRVCMSMCSCSVPEYT